MKQILPWELIYIILDERKKLMRSDKLNKHLLMRMLRKYDWEMVRPGEPTLVVTGENWMDINQFMNTNDDRVKITKNSIRHWTFTCNERIVITFNEMFEFRHQGGLLYPGEAIFQIMDGINSQHHMESTTSITEMPRGFMNAMRDWHAWHESER